jgi:S-DNA-T family DNA segregation ATPase FtsK/SpoIIIE
MAIQVAEGAPPFTRRTREAAPWYPSRPLTGFVMRRSPAARAVLASWEDDGARIITLDQFAAAAEWPGTGPVIVAGDAEEWQRHWRALSSVRSDHDLIVDAGCAPELRALTGERGLPPYCEPGRPRGWLMRSGASLERVVLPAGHDHRER